MRWTGGGSLPEQDPVVDEPAYMLLVAQHLCCCLRPGGLVIIEGHPGTIWLPKNHDIVSFNDSTAIVQHNRTQVVHGRPAICLSLPGAELGHLQLHWVLQAHCRLG